MSDQEDARPADRSLSQLGLVLWKKPEFPLSPEASSCNAPRLLKGSHQASDVNESRQHEIPSAQPDRRNDLEVLRRVKGITMVSAVACFVNHVIDKADEGQQISEHTVQPVGPEYRAMHQLMDPVDQERTHGP